MFLPILPDEDKVDLHEAGYPGLVAVYRPMDVLDKSQWFDECQYKVSTAQAQVSAVRRQLLRVEENGTAMQVENVDKTLAPFDPQNPKHLGALPIEIVTSVFNALMSRTSLTEGERKN